MIYQDIKCPDCLSWMDKLQTFNLIEFSCYEHQNSIMIKNNELYTYNLSLNKDLNQDLNYILYIQNLRSDIIFDGYIIPFKFSLEIKDSLPQIDLIYQDFMKYKVLL